METETEYTYFRRDSRQKRRHNDWRKAIRKRNIIRQYGFDWYDNLHQYSKNKIHCSCPMCRGKIKNKQACGPAECWPIQDRKRFDDMNQQLDEYMEENNEQLDSCSSNCED